MPGPLLALLPYAITAATAAYQAIRGAKQKREARALQSQANAEERSNLADARRMALTGIPEAQYQQALQNLYRNQAGSLAALRDRRSALAGVPAIQQSTNDALLGLASQDAQARMQNERVALNQANRVAGLTGNRAMQERSSGEALTGAALQNLFNTGTTAAYLSAFGGDNSIFGTGERGMRNRSILGTQPLPATGINSPSSALSGTTPNIPYANPY